MDLYHRDAKVGGVLSVQYANSAGLLVGRILNIIYMITGLSLE
jgi:hypothetical protein